MKHAHTHSHSFLIARLKIQQNKVKVFINANQWGEVLYCFDNYAIGIWDLLCVIAVIENGGLNANSIRGAKNAADRSCGLNKNAADRSCGLSLLLLLDLLSEIDNLLADNDTDSRHNHLLASAGQSPCA